MGKKICCICRRINQADRWTRAADTNRAELVHGLCPACFAETREKVRRIYGPVSVEMVGVPAG